MLLRLALETNRYHAQADEERLRGIDITSRDGYRDWLARIYGFEMPVERAVWRIQSIEQSVLQQRGKAGRLRRDLELLGMCPSDIDALPTVAVHLRTPAQALGWLFVMERHTLLAGLIKRHVARTLGPDIPCGYLSAYADTPGARFRALGEALGRHTRWCTPSSIVAGATEAFRTQRLWYRGALNSRPLPQAEARAAL